MFYRDLLLIDIESTGLNPCTHDLIQLAGILLDKKTLKEKASFNRYLQPTNWRNWDPVSMQVNGIARAVLKKEALPIRQALKEFSMLHKSPVLLAHWAGDFVDGPFLKKAYNYIHEPYPFDHHSFNIWPLACSFLSSQGKFPNKKYPMGFAFEDLVKLLHIPLLPRHDALNDCRNEAEVLRVLMKKLN